MRFYFSGLNDGWFASCFEAHHLFGYVGDRAKLQEELEKKSIGRRLIEIIGPKINLGTLFKALTDFDLLRVDPEKTLASQIINLVNEHENQRQLTDVLARTYKKGKSNGTYFTSVQLDRSVSLNALQGKLVTFEAQLLHRSSVAQYSPTTGASLRSSNGNWALSDFPPPGLVPENSRYNGKLLLLKEDEGFTETFQHLLPFCVEIGWYPYVRVSGFFDASRVQTEIHPTLSISLIEYRRPRGVADVMNSVVDFLEGELHDYGGRRNFLEEPENLLLFSYLAPILFKGTNMNPSEAEPSFAELAHEYAQLTEANLPEALVTFYESIPLPAQ